MSAVPDSSSLPEDRDEEFENVEIELGEMGTSNAMTELTGILVSLK